MLKFFQKLKVSQKLMIISILFMIPDSVLLSLFLISINSNIRFAQWEQYGNEYQRPLEHLLELLPEHQMLVAGVQSGTVPSTSAALSLQQSIDSAFEQLAAVDARLGPELQFTPEGLAKRGREHCRVENLKSEWLQLKRDASSLTRANLSQQHQHLIGDVRTMITHVGDNSNLILDPDLDSYYLMDVTLLALPEMQERLASVMEYGAGALHKKTLSNAERRQLAVHAALLKESDLDRITSSTKTALNEDPNFYGTSDTFQKRVPPVLQEFNVAASEFIRLLVQVSETDHSEVDAQALVKAGGQARTASFALWNVADQELTALLETRIHSFRVHRAQSLILTALALSAAVGFVAFITRSISRPLQKQARQLSESNQALQNQIEERKRMEDALRAAEEKYRGIFEKAVEGIFQTTPTGTFLVANPTLARIYGYASVSQMQKELTDVGRHLYVDPKRRAEFLIAMERHDRVQSFESQVYRKDGKIIWISEHARAVRDAAGTVLYYEGTVEDITERKRSEAELEKVNVELVKASRLAGKAEVATEVLHNVGNVLNSVNVSANFVADTFRKSRISDLPKICALLHDNLDDLGHYLTTDPKGKKVPAYFFQLTDHLIREKEALQEKMDLLRNHLDHIKEIVAMQQSYAKVSGITECIQVTELIEDALRLNAGALSQHEVDVIRRYDATPRIEVDKHKVLQILVNLIGNAKHACADAKPGTKQLVLRTRQEACHVKIEVTDSGVGIPPENLIRIFNHGFTTRKEGHGFGLHSGANAAKEMGGSLRAESRGSGSGATFILELPLQPPKAA